MASNAWGAPHTGKSSDHVSGIGRGRAGCWSCDWAIPPQAGSAHHSRTKRGWSWLYVCIFPRDLRLCTSSIKHAGVRRSEFLADTLFSSGKGMILVHEMLWALLHWFMMCAWLVKAAGPSLLQCALPDWLGVCAEGLNGPRLAPVIQTKIFSWSLLSRGAARDIYTSFANFKKTAQLS